MSIKTIYEQYQIINQSVKERLEIILPEVMRESEADMWLIACKEYNEDPLFKAIMPANYPTARRLCLIAFIKDQGKVRRLSLCMPDEGLEVFYERYWDFGNETQDDALIRLIKEFKPQRIAINTSLTFASSDGLSNGCFNTLKNVIDEKLFIQDDYLALRLLEKRTPTELHYLPEVVEVAYHIIEDVFSVDSIIPGKTSCDELEFIFRQKVNDLGLVYWFEPDVDLQRQGLENRRYKGIIEKGDLIHCDFGIRYLNMCTDTQRLAYIARDDENQLPVNLVKGMKDNDRFQDIVSECMAEGKTGNEVLMDALDKGNAENLKPILYSHPCNYFGHGPGPTIGLYNQQAFIPVRGEVPLINNTVWALELNTTSTFENEEWQFFCEETILFKNNEIHYLYPGRDKITFLKF